MEEDGNHNLNMENSMGKGKNTIVKAIYVMSKNGIMGLKFPKNDNNN